MNDENKILKAEEMYKTLCTMLDDQNIHYEKHPEDYVAVFTMTGEDIPVSIVAGIDSERELVRIFSMLPFTFGEDKRLEGAIALNQINYTLVDGSFDYNYEDGRVIFRLTSSYRESLISKELFGYMIACLAVTVDKYNDKLLVLAKGGTTLEDFLKNL